MSVFQYKNMVLWGESGDERLWANNLKVASSIRAVPNDVVSLGKALHCSCLWGMSLYFLLVALDKINVC